MKNPTIRVIFFRNHVSHVETWSAVPCGHGLHHRTFRTLEEAMKWFAERGELNPIIREH